MKGMGDQKKTDGPLSFCQKRTPISVSTGIGRGTPWGMAWYPEMFRHSCLSRSCIASSFSRHDIVGDLTVSMAVGIKERQSARPLSLTPLHEGV